jgi:hypothetical protein
MCVLLFYWSRVGSGGLTLGCGGDGVGAGSLGGVLMPSARNVTASTNMMLGSNPSF